MLLWELQGSYIDNSITKKVLIGNEIVISLTTASKRCIRTRHVVFLSSTVPPAAIDERILSTSTGALLDSLLLCVGNNGEVDGVDDWIERDDAWWPSLGPVVVGRRFNGIAWVSEVEKSPAVKVATSQPARRANLHNLRRNSIYLPCIDLEIKTFITFQNHG